MRKIVFCVSIFGLGLLASCSEQLAIQQPADASATTVPSAVKTTVLREFPQATQVSYSALDNNKVYGVDLKISNTTVELTVSANGAVLSSFKVSDDSTKIILPAAAKTYLSTNYSGYQLERLGQGTDADGNTLYKVLIEYNNQKITVVFDTNGVFVAEFKEPQRAGNHKGKERKFYQSTYDDLPTTIKDQLTGYTFLKAAVNADSTSNKYYFVLAQKDSVYYEFSFDNAGKLLKTNTYTAEVRKIEDKSLKQADLPTTIATYIQTNYAGWKYEKGTVISKNGVVDSYYILLSNNKKQVTLVFDTNGQLLKSSELELKLPKFEDVTITLDQLPDAIKTYLSTTYTGWTLDKAVVYQVNSVAEAYYVHIKVDNTKYHVYFDKDGKFLWARKG